MKAYLPEPARQRRLLIRTTGPQIILGKVRLLTSPGRGPSTGSDHCSIPSRPDLTGRQLSVAPATAPDNRPRITRPHADSGLDRGPLTRCLARTVRSGLLTTCLARLDNMLGKE